MLSKRSETRQVIRLDDITRHNATVNSTTYRAAVDGGVLRPHTVAPRRDNLPDGHLIWPAAREAQRRAYFARQNKIDGKQPSDPPWHGRIGASYGHGTDALDAAWLQAHKLPDLPAAVESASSSLVPHQPAGLDIDHDFKALSIPSTPGSPRSAAKTPPPRGKPSPRSSPSSINWDEDDELND